jgi:pimeloyl-ACP methyl ester carboxylesterase
MNFDGVGHEVALFDLLGFGDSPKPYLRYTIEKHLERLVPALQERGEVILVGHSLGAALALSYAARYPARVKALVLISLPCFSGVHAARQWFGRRSGGWIYTNYIAIALACMLTRRLARVLLPYLIRGYPRVVVEDLVKHNVMSSTTSLWSVIYEHDVIPDCERLPQEIDVTLIHAEDDDVAPFGAIASLAERFGWRLVRTNGTGHHPWLRATNICWSEIVNTAGH